MYQVGIISFFLNEDDPVFDNYVEAEKHAQELSDQVDCYDFYGVWEQDGGELLTIAHQGFVYTG